jgi:Tfp pilus assembly protein PilF
MATIRTSPDSVRPYNDLAGYYYLQNRADKAKEYYYKALMKYPSSTAMKNLGFIYTHEPLPINVPLSTMTTEELQNHALEAYSQGDFGTSMYYLIQLYRYDNQNIQVILMIARIYIEGQNFLEAEKVLTMAEKISPMNPNIYLSKGYMAFKQGKKDMAISYLKKVLEIDPSNQEALTNLQALTTMQ